VESSLAVFKTSKLLTKTGKTHMNVICKITTVSMLLQNTCMYVSMEIC